MFKLAGRCRMKRLKAEMGDTGKTVLGGMLRG